MQVTNINLYMQGLVFFTFFTLLTVWFGQQALGKYDTTYQAVIFDDSQKSKMLF